MSLSLDEVIRRIGATREEIIRTRAVDTVKIITDAKALIQDRVQEEGQTADGGTFGVYSAPYQVYREGRGLDEPPYPNVNFTKEGEMWRNMHVKLVEQGQGRVVVRITPESQENKDKLKYNVERFGQILELSDDEEDIIERTVRDRYLDIFRKNGLI